MRLPVRSRILDGKLVLRFGSLVMALLCASACADDPVASGERPETDRFTRTIVADGFDEPMAVDFDAAGQIYLVERTGGIRRVNPDTGESVTIGTIPVFTQGEGGLLGILLDRDFERSRRIYLYYTAAEERIARLSRFQVDAAGRLDLDSEAVILSWEHDIASHMGGGMIWEPGTDNLLLAVGENSVPTQYTPIHWTEEGGRREDSQRTSANTNDLRGKILRIRPLDGGGYEIPEGNLFPAGTAGARPEIYVMGTRNPWRISWDSQRGTLHWGEIGPDAGRDSAGIGPRGFDEFNVAAGPGNFGWPYFIADNQAYHSYDRASGQYGPPFDPASPVNDSPNNTGLRELPPARPALLAYPYAVSEAYPELNSGGRAAVGGPVYRREDFEGAPRPFPDYYDGGWFVVDFVRSWIMVLRVDESASNIVSMERFLPETELDSPIDMAFSPLGDLYVVEYGRAPVGRLSRISYNAGNRAPRVQLAADRTAGALPLEVALSTAGTGDPDGDEVQLRWEVEAPAGRDGPVNLEGDAPRLTVTRPGEYRVRVVGTDPAGAADTAMLTVLAGNEAPAVALEITDGNRTFLFEGDTIVYRVAASDAEDGSLQDGRLPRERLHVTAEFLASGIGADDLAGLSSRDATEPMRHARAVAAIAGSDCAACHTVEEPAVGPSFRQVAERYAGQPEAAGYLARQVIDGSRGVWGDVPMPAHPSMSVRDATAIAEYLLSIGDSAAAPRAVPPQGTVVLSPGVPVRPGSAYLLRASYTDAGAPGAAPIRATAAVLLRHPLILPENADSISEGTSFTPSTNDPGFIINSDGAHLAFRGVDLTGVAAVEVGALTRFYTWSHFIGGSIELRLGGADGPLVGGPVAVVPPPPRAPPAPGEGAPTGGVVLGADLEPPARISLDGAQGVNDLFVVFRNPEASRADALMLVRSIEFIPENGAVQ